MHSQQLIIMNLKNRRILVTGGAVRVGRAIALALADAGAVPVLQYHQSCASADELRALIRERGHEAVEIKADLSYPDECERLISEAGPLDGLVNNAALYLPDTLKDFDPEESHRQLQINAISPILLMKLFAEQCKSGAIVNILDRNIRRPDSRYFSYTLSKKMLYEATLQAACDLAPGITVNAVAPGPVLPPVHVREKAGEIMLDHSPTVEDVAAAVVYLMSAPAVTGQTLFVDSGQHLGLIPVDAP